MTIKQANEKNEMVLTGEDRIRIAKFLCTAAEKLRKDDRKGWKAEWEAALASIGFEAAP